MLENEIKRNFVLSRLLEKGVRESQEGIDIRLLDYDSLKYELVLQAFRDIDVEKEESKWF